MIYGADDPIRTDDRRITNALLYQLSYVGSSMQRDEHNRGSAHWVYKLVPGRRVELRTRGFSVHCSTN